MDCQFWSDKTVRPLPGEEWASDDTAQIRKPNTYAGPDISSARGAKILAHRLETYWRERGEPKAFDVYFVGIDESGHSVFSARPSVDRAKRAAEYDRNFPRGLILQTLQAFPDVTYAKLMAPRGAGKRPRLETQARAACIRAIKAAKPNISARQIALMMGVAECTVATALKAAQ
jgi:hypothetical protein